MLGLRDLLGRIDVHFHVNGLDDVQSLGRFGVVAGDVAAGKDGAFLDPVKAELVQVPQMLVRIDDRDHGFFVLDGMSQRGDQGERRGEESSAVERMHGAVSQQGWRGSVQAL